MHASRLLAAALLPCAILLPGGAGAAVLTWPGSPGCTGTLQACVDAAAAGDEIRLAADASFAYLDIARGLTLASSPGHRARLQGDIRARPTAGYALQLRDFDLRGRITLEDAYAHPGAGTLGVRGVLFDADGLGAAIDVVHSASGPLVATLVGNRLRVADQPTGIGPVAAHVRASADVGGPITLTFNHNQIEAGDLERNGLVGIVSGPAGIRAELAGNDVRGMRYGFGIQLASYVGPVEAMVANNAFLGSAPLAPGVRSTHLRAMSEAGSTDAGRISLVAANNTFAGGDVGVELVRGGAEGGNRPELNATLFNNLHTGQRVAATAGEGAPNVVSESNLVHACAGDGPWAGASPVRGDPLLTAADDARPRPGSAADDAGNGARFSTALDAFGASMLDADGMPRAVAQTMDIGAWDVGVRSGSFEVRAADTGAAVRVPALRGTAPPMVTGYRDPATPGDPYHRAGVAVGPNGVAGFPWATFALQGRFAVGDTFMVRQPVVAPLVFFVGGPASARFVLEHPALNARPELVLQVVRFAAAGAATPAEPVAVSYDPASARWVLRNTTGATLPTGSAYAVYAHSPGPFALRLRANSFDVAAGGITLREPILRGARCARAQLTAGEAGGSGESGTALLRAVPGSGEWRIQRADGSPVRPGEEYHVVLDRAGMAACGGDSLFSAGFEPP